MHKQTTTTTAAKAAHAILEIPSEPVSIGGKAYQVGKPSVATIILASGYASELPDLTEQGGDNILQAVMTNAKNLRALGKVALVLILGAKEVKALQSEEGRSWADWLLGAPAKPCAFERLVDELLEEMSVTELTDLISKRLLALDISGFFALTTSLASQNKLLAPTRSSESEVV